MLALATLINLHRRCQGSSLYGSEDHVKEFDVDNFNKSVYNQVIAFSLHICIFNLFKFYFIYLIYLKICYLIDSEVKFFRYFD